MKRKLTTFERHRHAKSVVRIHGEIRLSILEGSLRPGTILSQVQLAEQFGVSRTPLREALRMLQEEGLIQHERNRRPKVAGFDPDDVEAIYANRILLSSLGIAVSMPQLTEDDFSRLENALDEMREAGARDDIEAWEEAHRKFHQGLIMYANKRLQETINRLSDHSKLYRRLWIKAEPEHWPLLDKGHRAILNACRRRDRDAAVELLAKHLARSCLTVLAQAAPEHKATLVRSALDLVLAERPGAVPRKAKRLARVG